MYDWDALKMRVEAKRREREADEALLEILKRGWIIPIQLDPTLPSDTIKLGDATLTNIKEEQP